MPGIDAFWAAAAVAGRARRRSLYARFRPCGPRAAPALLT